MADDDLERRELQSLRDHLQELGEAARPAIEEWAVRHGFELRLVVTAQMKLPGDFRQNPVPVPDHMLSPAIGYARSTHIPPQGLEPEPLREFLGVDVMVSEYLPPGTAFMVNGRRLVAPDVLQALLSRVGGLMSQVWAMGPALGPGWQCEEDMRRDLLVLRHSCGVWIQFDRQSFGETPQKLIDALVPALQQAVQEGRTGQLQVMVVHHDLATGAVRLELGPVEG